MTLAALRTVLAAASMAGLLTGGCATAVHQPVTQAAIEADATFVALWWSEAQMENLDLDNPPVKSTLMTLVQWDASDPVGTLHPEQFEVNTSVSASSAVTRPLWIEISSRWGIGRLSDQKDLTWTDWLLVKQLDVLEPGIAQTEVFRYPVAIDAMQQTLFEQGRWPWVYQVTLSVFADKSKSVRLAEVTRQLDILAAD